VSDSPIEQLLRALDSLDVDAAVALMTPDCRLRTADGRRAVGADAVRELLTEFVAAVRSMTHRITGHWHEHEVWIAEVEADYELQDWLKLTALPRAFIVRTRAGALADIRAYGAHERPLADHNATAEGTCDGLLIGGRWIPPL
jgi:hypothetical protein